MTMQEVAETLLAGMKNTLDHPERFKVESKEDSVEVVDLQFPEEIRVRTCGNPRHSIILEICSTDFPVQDGASAMFWGNAWPRSGYDQKFPTLHAGTPPLGCVFVALAFLKNYEEGNA